MSIIEILNMTRNDVFKKNIITYFRFGIIIGIVFLFFYFYIWDYIFYLQRRKNTLF